MHRMYIFLFTFFVRLDLNPFNADICTRNTDIGMRNTDVAIYLNKIEVSVFIK